jgi:hypothetical protein
MKRKLSDADSSNKRFKYTTNLAVHPVSSALDSSDESDVSTLGESYISILQDGVKGDYGISYLLTDISNQLLLSQEVTNHYRGLKDPLQLKLDGLKERKFICEGNLQGIMSLNEQITKYQDILTTLPPIGAEETVKFLQEEVKKAEIKRKAWVEENKNNFDLGDIKDEEFVQKVHDIYLVETESITQEIETITSLQQKRNKLNLELKGLSGKG